MAYNFGIINDNAFKKAKQWLKGGFGLYSGGKPPFDTACDNNYQNYADNASGTGAIATYKDINSANQFEINAGHTLIDNSLTLNAVAAPATPTAVVNGTAGSTSYTYKVVGRAGSLQAPSSGKTVTTGAATLTSVNSITLTFVPTPGFLIYDIYRTASAGTPSSTGRIGQVLAALGSNVSSPTLTFTDTGLVADGSTCPTTNTSGAITGDLVIFGNVNVNALATPATPIATVNGTAGSTTNAYKIVARSGSPTTATGHTAASSAVSVTTCAATLTSVNSVTLTWQPVVGAVSYDIYRTASGGTPSSTGLIGSTPSRTTTFTDTGIAGDSSSAPSTNTTGNINQGTGTDVELANIFDTNGKPEIQFVATTNAVNGLVLTNAATGSAVNVTPGAASGSDTNIGLTINSKGTGALTLAPAAAAGTVVIGAAAGTGNITVGSSSAAESVLVGDGAGAPTVNVANSSTAGATVAIASAATATGNTDSVTIAGGNSAGTGAKTVAIAGGAPAGSGIDTVNIATGNAGGTAAKVVNIATGTPNTSGNNKVTVGGGTTTKATVNAAFTSYQATNFATAGGSNNAITVALTDAGGNNVTFADGLLINVKMGSLTLQGGANSLNFNGHGTDSIKKASNPSTDIGATSANAYLQFMCNGTSWLLMSQ